MEPTPAETEGELFHESIGSLHPLNSTDTKVTWAFDDWLGLNRDLEAYMTTTVRWMTDRYDSEWEDVNQQPGDGSQEAIDVLFDRAGGLMPHEFQWMTFSAVMREAATHYELYLTGAMEQVLNSTRRTLAARDRTPTRRELAALYGALSLDPYPPSVDLAITLRNLLAHRKGELRTDELREKFAAKGGTIHGMVVHLNEYEVDRHMAALAASVRKLDSALWSACQSDLSGVDFPGSRSLPG